MNSKVKIYTVEEHYDNGIDDFGYPEDDDITVLGYFSTIEKAGKFRKKHVISEMKEYEEDDQELINEIRSKLENFKSGVRYLSATYVIKEHTLDEEAS